MKCASVTKGLEAHTFSPPTKWQGCHKLTPLYSNIRSEITYSKPLKHLVVVYFCIHLPLLPLKLIVLHHSEYMLQSLIHHWHLLCHLNGLISIGHTLQFTLLSY